MDKLLGSWIDGSGKLLRNPSLKGCLYSDSPNSESGISSKGFLPWLPWTKVWQEKVFQTRFDILGFSDCDFIPEGSLIICRHRTEKMVTVGFRCIGALVTPPSFDQFWAVFLAVFGSFSGSLGQLLRARPEKLPKKLAGKLPQNCPKTAGTVL